MDNSSGGSSGGIGFGGALFLVFLVFLVLKLTAVIDWSWWYVTLPLWGPVTVVLAIAGLMCIVAIPVALLRSK